MSLKNVRNYLKEFSKETSIIELNESSATVELAAKALNVAPERIAKTLSFKSTNNCILIVTAGDAKIDNKKFKDYFGYKAKMLTADEVLSLTSHEIGGVCPFATPVDVKIYCDISLKRFDTIFPACGSRNSAIELNCSELFEISKACAWIDICKNWQETL